MIRRLLPAFAALLVSASAAAVDKPDLFVLGSDNDPRVREADLLATQRRFYSATSELLRLQADRPQQRLPAEYYRRLADASLSFGIRNRAEQVYRELLAANPEPTGDQAARIRLSEFMHQRGYDQDAVRELRAIRDKLPESLHREWQDTLARTLLSQGRYSEAVEVLSDKKLEGKISLWADYNLGVALVNDGRVGQGLNVLDRVGRSDVLDPEEIALRDQANLVLGYHFLRQSQGGTAIPIFERISSKGAISNRALLGLGWAHLAPRGSTQRKVAVGDEAERSRDLDATRSLTTIGVLLRPGFLDDDIYRRIGIGSFRRSRGTASDEEALKRALVPWLELASRDPIDPTVQEGLLAIPYCLDKLGAHQQARQFYEKAIAALEAGRKRLDLTAWYVKSGRMLETMILRTAESEAGWMWQLNDLPNGDETFYLQRLIGESRFQEPVKNYRDLKLMQSNLESWKARIDQLQETYAKRPPPAPPAAVLINEARERKAITPDAIGDAVPDPADVPPPTLKSADALSLPSAVRSPAPPSGSPQQLQVATNPVPAAFVGTYERLDQMKARIDAMLPKLTTAEERAAKIVETMCLDNVAAQKRVTEKYLIEARFALARVYDRELKGAPR